MNKIYNEYTTDHFALYNGDCVQVVGNLPDNSVDYTIYSPPFASLYTYSDSSEDMGNARSYEEFFEHFAFLATELFRVTREGRLMSFHCANIPMMKERDGVIALRDFRGDLIRAFQAVGFVFHTEVMIWKDPVTEMQRTKSIGLLHKQVKKDSCMSRMGIPDYVVTMRKAGPNDKPVSHTPEEFPVSQWQKWASPVWMDIDQGNTLNYMQAREAADERHICPLQLDVIERCLVMWSRPGDVVLSPFAGIGSEGYMAVKAGRRFIGAELKESYYRTACKHLDMAVVEAEAPRLFDLEAA